ncbi:MAG: site-specific integrase [Planctomycetales bacterium]|nr:site-specific integrase [Planctomycetales bacterium]
MTNSKPLRVPKYSHHKPSDRARVIIDGRHVWLGKYGSASSKKRYRELIAKWAAGTVEEPNAKEPITLAELMAQYLTWASGYYVKNGQHTREYGNTKDALKIVRQLFELLPIGDFGPKALVEVRTAMIAKGWTRKYINKQVDRVKRMVKWGVSQELVSAETYQALRTLAGLKRGRTTAPDNAPVQPVREAHIAAVTDRVSEAVSTMIQVQRLTGCRPGEVCIIRPCDLDRSGDVWRYMPESHKTEHHDRHRVIFVGPKAQALLMPWLLRPATSYCFSPKETMERRHRSRTRKTPLNQGNRKGYSSRSRDARKAQRVPSDVYTTNSYRQAIQRACDEAKIPRWTPHQLRHTAATEIRSEFGLEAAQTVLGHATAAVTEIYAERDQRLAADVARKTG